MLSKNPIPFGKSFLSNEASGSSGNRAGETVSWARTTYQKRYRYWVLTPVKRRSGRPVAGEYAGPLQSTPPSRTGAEILHYTFPW
jgi:hypothetical protein